MVNAPSETTIHRIEHTSALRRILNEQQQDIAILRAIIQQFKGCKDVGIDPVETRKATEQVCIIEKAQKHRFRKLDEIIFDNRREIQKEKTADDKLLTYGKEVRKLEAGLRTLRLFTNDVIEMLTQSSTVMNRADDRIAYFEKREPALETDIQQWIAKLAP